MAPTDLIEIDTTSEEFLGRWRHLVSTTNWEKGRIISEWRAALRSAKAGSEEYSDEAWSRRAGSVSPQHVGRLRRTYDRFGNTFQDFGVLYWSHFQMALDWEDAEMWLEGAVQNGWSVSEMRRQRAEVLGTVDEPADDAAADAWDEDAAADLESPLGTRLSAEELAIVRSTQNDDAPGEPIDEAAASERRSRAATADRDSDDADYDRAADVEAPAPPFRPFAALPPLPADVTEAFDAFKLCILRHKLAGFQEIPRDDLLSVLDALRSLLLAPAS